MSIEQTYNQQEKNCTTEITVKHLRITQPPQNYYCKTINYYNNNNYYNLVAWSSW